MIATRNFTLTRTVHFRQGRNTKKVLAEGDKPEASTPPPPRVPRISRLMALAIRLESLIKAGQVADYADLARLGHVTRARMTQIMNLLHLAPDIQEAILFLPPCDGGHDSIHERQLRPIVAEPDWRKQQRMWGHINGPKSGVDATALVLR